ncbi:unnamed protein product [Musa hybrid cultivar]
MGGNPSSKRTSTTAPITWQTWPMAPAPVNSSVIFPLGAAAAFGGGAEGAGAAEAADVAYSTARERRNPVGEGREEMRAKGVGEWCLVAGDRRAEARRSEARIRREAMAGRDAEGAEIDG